jgi:hypothetical protein
MAAPSYTTDLVTYNDATSATGWGEATGMATSAGPGVDTDLAIHGSICISQDRHGPGLSSQVFTGTGPTLPTNGAFFIWTKFFAPNSLDTLANGGVRVAIGSGTGDYYGWFVDGSDTYQYGGWINYAVDPLFTADQTVGSPGGAYNTVGNGWNSINEVKKGNPMNTDIIRYGRGTSIFTLGDLANGYATFDGYALVNDNPTTGRFGLIQDQGGSYLWKGLMSLGLSGTPVDFRDSNVAISIANTTKVSDPFNKIEVHNTGSNIDWDGIGITKVGSVSKGQFEMVDGATLVFSSCTFTDMDTFIFNKGAGVCNILTNTFRRCGVVTQGGATITSTLFDAAVGSTALLADDLDLLTDCSFNSSGTGHAIELTVVGTYSWGNSLSGYDAGATGSPVTPTATGDEAIFVNVGSGTVTLNVAGGATLPSIRSAGATVNVVSSFTLTLTDIPSGTSVTLVNSATRVELQHETSTGTDITYAHGGGETIDILLMSNTIDPNLSDIFDLLLPGADSAIKFQTIEELNYANP